MKPEFIGPFTVEHGDGPHIHGPHQLDEALIVAQLNHGTIYDKNHHEITTAEAERMICLDNKLEGKTHP